MDLEYVGRVLARLKPFVHDGVIRRTRLERVLGSLQASPDDVRPEVERLLAKARVRVEEDARSFGGAPAPQVVEPQPAQPDAPAEDDTLVAPTGVEWVPPGEAVAAARRRIAKDRVITNHAKVLLRPDEEVGLGILVRGGSGDPLDQGEFARLTGESRQAAECLLLHNQGLVHSVAKRYAPSGMTYDDLFQHGVFGLIRAVELFDPTLGYKFSTYAMNWVRQSITRGIANEARLIRLPVHMVERINQVWAARSKLTFDDRAPSVHELALACDLTDEQVVQCLRLGPSDLYSLDAHVGPEGEGTLGELLDYADPCFDVEDQVEFALVQEQLDSVLDTLSEREAGVVKMRFGLTDGRPKTLDEIGKVYGVTRERIRQIEAISMSKLRHPMRSQVLRDYLN